MQKVGKKLDEAKEAYNATLDKAETGRMTVLGSARKLVKLGVKVSTVHPLPQHESDEDQTPQLPLGDSTDDV